MLVLGCSRAHVLTCLGAVVLVCSVAAGEAREQHAVPAAGASVPAGREARQQNPPTGTALIAGSVVDATSGQPIPEVTVTLRSVGRIDAEINAEGKVTAVPNPKVVTDAQGRFAFADLRVGTYTLMATNRTGFTQGSAFVELGANQQITDVTVRLNRFGSLAGTIRDEAGDPVVKMKVDALLKRTVGFRPILLPRGQGVTDDRGQFRIGDLPPGDYLLCACGREALSIDKTLLPLLGATPPSAAAVTQRLDASIPTFAPTFHSGSTRASEAISIVVGSADDRAGIDITVRAITPRRVSGHLTGMGLKAATGLTLLLVPENDRPEAQTITAIESVSVTPMGAFDFVAVPPGRYSLEAYPTEGKHDLWASMPVAVGEQDVTGLVVPLSAGATVAGRIEFSGSSARPDAAALEMARVTLSPAAFTPRTMIAAGASGSVGHSGPLDRDGQFRIEGVPPGRYIATASRLGPDWQLTDSIRTATSTSSDPVVTLDEKGLSGLVITMSDAVTAMVLGTVVLDRHEAPQVVSVLLFPAEPATWADAFRFPGRFAVTSVSNTRTFRLTGVPPGEYFAVVVATETNMGPDQFELWSRSATRISLRAGETKTIELRR